MLAFFTMHISGALGMARRIAVYREEYFDLNILTTVGYGFTAVGSLILFISIVESLFRPKDQPDDPWDVNDLQQGFEFATSSPPPAYNYEKVPPIPVAEHMGSHGH